MRSSYVVTHDYQDPAGAAARALGLPGVSTELWLGGGEVVGSMIAGAALDLAAGRVDLVALVAGEAWYSKTAAERGRGPLPQSSEPSDARPDRVVGERLDYVDPVEAAVGLDRPIMQYPLLENAIRSGRGTTVAEHRAWLGELWARFTAVAETNPYTSGTAAATRPARSPDPSRSNRTIGLPYTKLMVFNEQVDQAAAVLVTTVGTARRLGIPADRWVFPWMAARGAAPTMSRRANLHTSDLARLVGRTLWDAASTGPDEVAQVDLYSCFPSAVQQQADGYGLTLDRRLTVTGGMRFAGGPWTGYPMHGLASMVEVLRGDPGSLGLCSANGGVVSKLAGTLLSSEPPTQPFRLVEPLAELSRLAARRGATSAEAAGVHVAVESYTVMFDRDEQPRTGFVAALLPDGSRAWGRSEDPSTVRAMADEEVLGRAVTFDAEGQAHLL